MNTSVNTSHQSENILAFDTSGDTASVALWADNHIQSVPLPFGTGSQSQASRLLSVMQELLTDARITFQDLHVIATPTGPGSFTGIRLGLATAQGLALSTKARCFAPTTFQNYAFGAWKDGAEQSVTTSFLVTLATKRDSFYTQTFDKTLQPLSPASLNTEDEILNMLAASPRMFRVERLSLLEAESLIYLYFHFMETGRPLPHRLLPYYLHNPEFIKQNPCSL